MVFYNEHDSFAASWLRELMKEGVIALGEVDERSIEDVQARDLKGFTQCHFFAGIGVWSYALKQSGWADDSAVWTGSCPCQSFSASGKRGGFSDKRHLWPAWFRLIRECAPDIVFGEQVASKDGLAWFDVVSSDLEGAGYALGAADTCAAGFGAPHIRQRLYFVADALLTTGRELARGVPRAQAAGGSERLQHGNLPERFAGSGQDGLVADAAGHSAGNGELQRIQQQRLHPQDGRDSRDAGEREREAIGRGLADSSRRPPPDERRGTERRDGIDQPGKAGELGHAVTAGLQRHAGDERDGDESRREREDEIRPASAPGWISDLEQSAGDGRRERWPESERLEGRPDAAQPSLTNGFWRDAEWLWCRDQKYRPTQPGLFPLASGIANRVGTLRGAGNALTAPQAQGFIEAFMDLSQSEDV